MLEIGIAAVIGFMLGAFAVVTGIAALLHRATKASFATPSAASARSGAMDVAEMPNQAELDAEDAYRNLAAARNRLQDEPRSLLGDLPPLPRATPRELSGRAAEASLAARGDAPAHSSPFRPPCGFCARVRAALRFR